MRIDNENDDVAMVLSRDDMVQLRAFLDNHLMIPKYGASSTMPMSVTSKGNIGYSTSNFRVVEDPVEDPADTWEIFGKLLRALDLILDDKENKKNE
jgi:hypothetical protein